MVRMQFYIYKRQNDLLKRLAQRRGVSEAEIIRQAIDHEISGGAVPKPAPSLTAMDGFERTGHELSATFSKLGISC